MDRVIQQWVDKTAQTGQRLNTSQVIYLFSEYFPPVMFPVSSQKRAVRLHIPTPAFLHLITRANFFIHPALTHQRTKTKIRFPHHSRGPLFLSSSFYIMPSKTEAPDLLPHKRNLRKPVHEKKTLNLKENEVLPSLVVTYHKSIDILTFLIAFYSTVFQNQKSSWTSYENSREIMNNRKKGLLKV